MRTRITIIALSIGVIAWNFLAPKLMTAATSNTYVLQVSEPDQLDLYIEQLVFAESSGHENIQIVDTNGEWSRGCLMYQDETWQTFSKKYGVDSTPFDCAAARYVTKQVLLHERYGWANWRTSVSRIGKPPV